MTDTGAAGNDKETGEPRATLKPFSVPTSGSWIQGSLPRYRCYSEMLHAPTAVPGAGYYDLIHDALAVLSGSLNGTVSHLFIFCA